MRIGFLGIGAPGHLNPMTTLARTLQSRKHDVVLISLPIAALIFLSGLMMFLMLIAIWR